MQSRDISFFFVFILRDDASPASDKSFICSENPRKSPERKVIKPSKT